MLRCAVILRVALMNTLTAYGWLSLAVASEVAGTTLLARSEQFTRLAPSLGMALFYACSFYFLSQALKGVPLGVAYAVWGGVGIVLTALVSVVVFRQPLDAPAMLGIGMIVAGVLVMNLFSQTAAH